MAILTKKRGAIALILLFVGALLVLLTGCGAANDADSSASGGGSESNIVYDEAGRKLVYDVYLDITVGGVGETAKAALDEAKSRGGYVEWQSEGGDGEEISYSNLVLRIPTAKLDEYVAAIGAKGKVTNKRVNITDITVQYVNASARKQALENRKALLEGMLSDELAAADKIKVIDEISSVESELMAIALELNNYQSLADYSTVHLTLSQGYSSNKGWIAGVVVAGFVFVNGAAAIVVLAVLFANEKRKNSKNSK